MNTKHFLMVMFSFTCIAAQANVAGKTIPTNKVAVAAKGVNYTSNMTTEPLTQLFYNQNLGGLQSYFQTNTVQQHRQVNVESVQYNSAFARQLAAVSYNNQQ